MAGLSSLCLYLHSYTPTSLLQHLMKRIQRGPVRGISLKLQEEERERRMDFVPDESAINTDAIEVDKDTMDMLRTLGMANLPGITVAAAGARPEYTGDRKQGGDRAAYAGRK
jgi:small subunit ribosomal protein S17e